MIAAMVIIGALSAAILVVLMQLDAKWRRFFFGTLVALAFVVSTFGGPILWLGALSPIVLILLAWLAFEFFLLIRRKPHAEDRL